MNLQGHRPSALRVNNIGKRYGKLVARQMVERDQVYNRHVYAWDCDCGGERICGIDRVRRGNKKFKKIESCGKCD